MRQVLAKAVKGSQLLRRPAFARAALRHRVAAAVEHLYPLAFSRAATLVDIGANKGQFSLAFRATNSAGVIHAFEPLPEAADRYERLFGADPRVTLHRAALSDKEGTAPFHVTSRSDSSSLLAPGQGQSQAFGVRGDRVIEVPVRRLDQVLALPDLAKPLLIKIDVQGAELGVLDGCGTIGCADFIYLELSFVELYEGQPLFGEVASYMAQRGFKLAGVFNQVETARFGPTQADFLFSRAAGAADGDKG